MEDKNQFIVPGAWKDFLTLPDEKLLVVIRKHPFLLIGPVFCLVVISLLCIAALYYVCANLFNSGALFLSSTLSVLIISASFLLKLYIDWYFHVYMVTNRKILEVSFAPLTAHLLNNVLLDQVNCTEIDIRTDGLINELIDMGDVVITFDRPTHQDEFNFINIQNSRKIGTFLSNQLVTARKMSNYPIWYRPKNEKKYKFMEEIFPVPAV